MKNILIAFAILFTSCQHGESVIDADTSDTVRIIKVEYLDSLVTPMQRADFKVIYFDFNEMKNPMKDSIIHFFNHVISEKNKTIKIEGREFVNSILLDSFSANYSLIIEVIKEKETMDYFILNKNVYTYLGGAHPNSIFQYLMFSKKTGGIAKIEDFIKKTEWNNFIKVNEKYFKIARVEDDTTSINNIDGCILPSETKTLPLANSWYLDELGLHVTYNQYEVLCYAAGTTEYVIPLNEMKPFLK
jgi:hypothetical protein